MRLVITSLDYKWININTKGCTKSQNISLGPKDPPPPGVNILHYSQIKYLGKVSIFWCFWEEFLLFLRILMKNTNYLVDFMVYASLLGKSLFLSFGKGFHVFVKYSPLHQSWPRNLHIPSTTHHHYQKSAQIISVYQS